jgi:hypothetical protein
VSQILSLSQDRMMRQDVQCFHQGVDLAEHRALGLGLGEGGCLSDRDVGALPRTGVIALRDVVLERESYIFDRLYGGKAVEERNVDAHERDSDAHAADLFSHNDSLGSAPAAKGRDSGRESWGEKEIDPLSRFDMYGNHTDKEGHEESIQPLVLPPKLSVLTDDEVKGLADLDLSEVQRQVLSPSLPLVIVLSLSLSPR